MKTQNKQAGITLIEMMIAMLIGLLVSGAVITIFISNVKSSSENIKMIHLNQELRTVMGFISDELKRAGYSGTSENDHMNFFSTTAQCILYSYDLDEDGDVDDDEKFGFRLENGNTIQWGTNVPCADDVQWRGITDPDTAEITAFTITPIDIPAGTSVDVKQVEIDITGQTTLRPGIASRTIIETIRVRNDDAS